VAVALAFGSWLRAPALSGSLISDDWDQYAMYAGLYPIRRSPLDFFNFVPSDSTGRQALLRSGRLPWWSDPNIHIAFLRPLASALVWADYALLHADRTARPAHLHSAVWWAASGVAAAALFQEVLPPAAAAIAVMLYAVDDANALPVAWCASLSELVAVTLMTWALWAHLDWKRRRVARSRWLCIALVWMAMASGEHAVALSALLIACELSDHSASLSARLRTLWPLVLPIVVLVVVRASLGYGASGSRFYVDPIADPVRYLRAAATSVPLLAGDLGLGGAPDYWYRSPP